MVYPPQGIAAGVDVSDADALVTDAKAGKTFYSVAPPRKTGTMPTQNLDPASENVPAGYYEATTLSTVDPDLAVGNIKSGVTIFGKLGTFVGGAITHDVQNEDVGSENDSASPTYYYEGATPGPNGDATLVTKTIACAQDTVAEAAYYICCGSSSASPAIKLQLYLDGVAQGETATITNKVRLYHDMAYKAVSSGNRTAYVNAHNYGGSPAEEARFNGGVFIAACKLT